jgi:hypothetical protein
MCAFFIHTSTFRVKFSTFLRSLGSINLSFAIKLLTLKLNRMQNFRGMAGGRLTGSRMNGFDDRSGVLMSGSRRRNRQRRYTLRSLFQLSEYSIGAVPCLSLPTVLVLEEELLSCILIVSELIFSTIFSFMSIMNDLGKVTLCIVQSLVPLVKGIIELGTHLWVKLHMRRWMR